MQFPDPEERSGDSFDFRLDLENARARLRQQLAEAEQFSTAKMSKEQRIGMTAFVSYAFGPMAMRHLARRKRRRRDDA